MSFDALIQSCRADIAKGTFGTIATASGQGRIPAVLAELQEYTPAHSGYAAASFQLHGMTSHLSAHAIDAVCSAIAAACDNKMVPVKETLRRVKGKANVTLSCHLAPVPVTHEFQSVAQARQHGFVAEAKNLFFRPDEGQSYHVSEANGRIRVSRSSDLDTDEAIEQMLASRLSPARSVACASAAAAGRVPHFSEAKREAMQPGMLVSYLTTAGKYDLGFTVTASAGQTPRDDSVRVLSMMSVANSTVEIPVDNIVDVYSSESYLHNLDLPQNVAVASIDDIAGLETYYARMRDLNPKFWQQWVDLCEKQGLDMVMLFD